MGFWRFKAGGSFGRNPPGPMNRILSSRTFVLMQWLSEEPLRIPCKFTGVVLLCGFAGKGEAMTHAQWIAMVPLSWCLGLPAQALQA